MALESGADSLSVASHSQLVVSQISGDFEAKDGKMMKDREKVKVYYVISRELKGRLHSPHQSLSIKYSIESFLLGL